MRRILAWPFLLLQLLLPKHLLTTLVHRIARVRMASVKDFLIRRYVAMYGVDTDEADKPVPGGYATLNDFFTRALANGARPIDATVGSIVSPVDGTVSAAGRLESDALLQAKGMHYSLHDLLMTDVPDAARFENGVFVTFYLAPRDYHRVHCPLDANLVAARHVPGALYSVNASTVAVMPRLFTRNERLICHFDSVAGPLIVVFVGAMNVGSISTPWTGAIRPRRKGVVEDIDLLHGEYPSRVGKGELLGWFNMGSSVIVLLPPGAGELDAAVSAGTQVRMGQVIGQLTRIAT